MSATISRCCRHRSSRRSSNRRSCCSRRHSCSCCCRRCHSRQSVDAAADRSAHRTGSRVERPTAPLLSHRCALALCNSALRTRAWTLACLALCLVYRYVSALAAQQTCDLRVTLSAVETSPTLDKRDGISADARVLLVYCGSIRVSCVNMWRVHFFKKRMLFIGVPGGKRNATRDACAQRSCATCTWPLMRTSKSVCDG